MVKTRGGNTNGQERKQLCTPVVMSKAKTALSLPSRPTPLILSAKIVWKIKFTKIKTHFTFIYFVRLFVKQFST